MWLLTNVASGHVLIVISEKSKYTVGRVGADLVIADDSSISRAHAFLHITAKEINETDASDSSKVNELLELEDAGSKYGTFHNDGIIKNVGIGKEVKIALAHGDRIRFGVLKSMWTVTNITPFVATSVLPTENAQLLKQYLDVLGGCILNDGWNEKYTHLTLAEINMTSKLLHALLDQKPIVTCDYWRNIVQAARRGKHSMPQVTSYLPPNPNNIDLTYNAKRQQIFKSLTFVFLHVHHFKTYGPIVEKAGGKSKHLNEGIQKSFLVRNDVVVIQYVPSTESQSSQTINTIEDCLKLQSRRTVPEFEIGLAIIQCSTEKYCNPCYHPADQLELVKANAAESCKQDSLILTNSTSLPLNADDTEVFVPETDRTTSTNLTHKSANNQGIEPRGAEQTDSAAIESQNFESKGKDSVDVAMSSLEVKESVQEANKRKRIRQSVDMPETLDSQMDSDDDELLNFAAKKAHLDDKPAGSAKQTPKASNKPLPIEINKRTSKKTMIDTSAFLEKSQTDAADNNGDTIDSTLTAKQGAKRARVAVIDNSDDDDLFCFGGVDKNNVSHNAKRTRKSHDDVNETDEDLFNFGGGGGADDENQSTDLVETGAMKTETKNNRPKIVMPKPKLLPAKICITAWLDCSLGALHIKAEEVKKEVENIETKENNDISVGKVDDSKDFLEPIKGGCVVTMLNTKSLLQASERNSDGSGIQASVEQANDNLNGNIKNFKKFIKKFQPQNRRVIRTVSSTVCGSLV